MTNIEIIKEEIAALRAEIEVLRQRQDILEASQTVAAAAAVPPGAAGAAVPPGLQQQMVPAYAVQAAVAAPPWTTNAATGSWVTNSWGTNAATGSWGTGWATGASSSGDIGFAEDGSVDGFNVHNHASFRRKAEQARFMVNKAEGWYCELCKIWGTDDHLISKGHVRKFGNWLYEAKNQYPDAKFDDEAYFSALPGK